MRVATLTTWNEKEASSDRIEDWIPASAGMTVGGGATAIFVAMTGPLGVRQAHASMGSA